jgi:hypothetical protein
MVWPAMVVDMAPGEGQPLSCTWLQTGGRVPEGSTVQAAAGDVAELHELEVSCEGQPPLDGPRQPE